jgi:hypothetical protein
MARHLVELKALRTLGRPNNRGRSSRRRGITSLLAMLYLVLFSALALGFYAQITVAAQLSGNEARICEALSATESGVAFMRYQLSKVDIPPETPSAKAFEELYMQLAGYLDGTQNLKQGNIGYALKVKQKDGSLRDQITVPGPDETYVAAGPAGNFRITLTNYDTFVRLKVVGRSDRSVTARAAQTDVNPVKRFAMASMGPLTFNGQGKLDGYDSSAGAYNAATATPSGMAANGDITTTGNTVIKGDANPGVGKKLIKNAGDTITGSTANLTAQLVFPPVSAGPYATANNNVAIPAGFLSAGALNVASGKTCALPAGTYYVTGLTVSGTLDMTAPAATAGPVVIYVAGNVSLSGTIKTFKNLPANFKIMVCKPGTTVKAPMTGSLYAVITAPESDITMGGNNTIDIYGAIVGKSILLEGNTNIHADRRAFANASYVPVRSSYLEVLP